MQKRKDRRVPCARLNFIMCTCDRVGFPRAVLDVQRQCENSASEILQRTELRSGCRFLPRMISESAIENRAAVWNANERIVEENGAEHFV